MASAPLSVWEKAIPQLSPWCWILQFFPVCHQCLSSCYPSAGAQREWVWVCLCGGSLRGNTWGSSGFLHQLNPCWSLQPEVVGTYLPDTGTLGWGAWCGAGTSCSWDILPEFLSTTGRCEISPFHICTSITSLVGCGFFKSVVVRLPFSSISDSSKWWSPYILVHFDVFERRGDMSAYAAILTGSLYKSFREHMYAFHLGPYLRMKWMGHQVDA